MWPFFEATDLGTACFNKRQGLQVTGTSNKLLDKDVTTYQEHLTSCWTKMLQRIRNGLQVAGRRCYNVSGTSYKLLDKDVTTYQERLASCWTKMLQRIRKSWLTTQATGRYYTPPEPPRKPPAKKRQFQKWQQSCPSRGAVTKNMPWGVKSKQWMNQYLLADEAYGWKTFLANHCC